MKTKGKTYLEPAINVITLRQRNCLLSESAGVNAERSGYGKAISTTWGESEE